MNNEMSHLNGVKVLLGVSGGVAVYKAVDLASKLTAAGAKVQTVMTDAAEHFVCAKSFEAVTGAKVHTSLWSSTDAFDIDHIALAEWADIVVVAPATANIIGKIAGGIADDLLSTMLCVCWKKPKIIAPAMNTNMWENPIVQANVEKIKTLGYEIVGPAAGRLACGSCGTGRMSEAAEILAAVENKAAQL